MKKLIAILLALTLILSTVACGNRPSVESDIPTSTEQSTEQPTPSEPSESSSQSTNEQQDNPFSTPQTPAPQSPTPQPTGHSHSYSSAVTAATCSSQGYTTFTCSCGHSYKDNYTSAAHSYSKYKCTKCGLIDKSNAYNYLIEWVKTHGTVDGSWIEFRVTNYNSSIYDGGLQSFTLSYNANYDQLTYNCSGRYEGTLLYTTLFLNSYYYGTTYEPFDICGYITPSSFTNNSPISYIKYTGDPNLKNTMCELARLQINTLLGSLSSLLSQHNVGITIADLGFTAY